MVSDRLTKVIDTEVRVVHKDAARVGFCEGRSEPVGEVIYDHPDFPIVVDKMSIEAQLHSMEESNIGYAWLSGLSWIDSGLSRENNSYVEEAVRSRPEKFKAFYIPCLTNIGEAVKEIEDLDSDVFMGVEIIPKWQGITLDSELLEPIIKVIQERQLALKSYTCHPIQSLDGDVPFRWIKFLQNHRDLKVVIPHLGGLLCLYGLLPDIKKLLNNTVFITSVSSTMQMVKFAAEVNEENIVFGTDVPFNHCHDQITPIRQFINLNLSGSARENILYRNADRFLESLGK